MAGTTNKPSFGAGGIGAGGNFITYQWEQTSINQNTTSSDEGHSLPQARPGSAADDNKL